MKRLIKELNERMGLAHIVGAVEYAKGISDAIEVVQKHNPWTSVADELPTIDENTTDCSINVWVTDGEKRNIGFYDFAEGVWIMGEHYAKVTHWAYLPEVQYDIPAL